MNKNSRGIAVILPIILILLVLGGIGYIVFNNYQQKQKTGINNNERGRDDSSSARKVNNNKEFTNQQVKVECNTDQASMINWKIYNSDAEYGYSLKYPECFKVSEGGSPGSGDLATSVDIYYPQSYHGRYYTIYYSGEEFMMFVGYHDNQQKLKIDEWYKQFKSLGDNNIIGDSGIQIIDEYKQLYGEIVEEKDILAGSLIPQKSIQVTMRYQGDKDMVEIVHTFIPINDNKVMHLELYSTTEFGNKLQDQILSTFEFNR